ncbi:MAG: hypothetical protein LBV76_00865, partial [Deltaproteobacteria bacterium]|nr:hypothetical protein [Deltaproteobacteria bacterium]
MSIRSKITLLLIGTIIIIALGASLAVRITSLDAAESQFSMNAAEQLERVDELIQSVLQTGGQVAVALSKMPERQQALGQLTNYTATTEPTTLNSATFSP